MDPETGLYYFGARYYDARTSVWQSTDPILASYLVGQGSGSGVFTPANMNLYGYSHQRPIIMLDPDGREVGRIDWDRLSALTVLGAGGAVIGGAGGFILGVGTEVIEETTPYAVAGANWVGAQMGSLWNAITGSGSDVTTTTTTTTTTATDTTGGRLTFFHGSDLTSALSLLNGANLDAGSASSLKHAGGAVGFYLATNLADAQHFGALAGGGTIAYSMTPDALAALTASGATMSPIAPGRNYNPQGEELFIPPSAFGTFNAEMAAGRIFPMPVPD